MTNSIEPAETKICFSHLLELAAANDVQGFKEFLESNPDAVDEIGLWYGRKPGSRSMVLEHRTPLMVASMYGSLDVMKLILSLSEGDINRSCGPDKSTALHCAAFGASSNAVEAVNLLLLNGADPNVLDAKGNRPCDVINVSRFLPHLKSVLEELLNSGGNQKGHLLGSVEGLTMVDSLSIPSLLEPKTAPNGVSIGVSSGGLETPSSPIASKGSEKKEYPIDPSIPDIKNSIYGTDEFRMYSFKVRPCSRAYSHDWTECPFVHPGENARRRDPRKFHYSCVPCPDFRKGTCRRGDMCEYAHGVFECWLHPAQYRTRLCKDGTGCDRRVCFFAHTPEELRPLYASTGSAVPSPRAPPPVMDMAAALNNFFPGSPSGNVPSPSPFTPPMSPSGGPHSPTATWQNMNMNMNMNVPPALHLPGSNINMHPSMNNLQTSRLRSSLNARDIQGELELEQLHILNDMSCYNSQPLNSPSVGGRSKTMAPSNLDELFSIEVSSPRFSDQIPAFSPSHKTAVFNHHFQQQQSMLSPINTQVFSPKAGSFGPSSPRLLSPRGIEPQSPLNARLSALALREKQHQQMRSLSARDLGSHLPRDLMPDNIGLPGSPPVGSWANNGKPNWGMNGGGSVDDMNGVKRSFSINGGNNNHHSNGEEPDLSWVQSLVKDSPSDSSNKEQQQNHHGSNSNPQVESVDHSGLGAWLDQIAAL